ncbi:hypothetical protein Lal_00009924 [Lupinus albus]|uniref:Uncharacterized protein n=1 Tax=Lupinus albus TaxID=3870 RepID=A0A6A5LI63_LUPAL|nr:hypothetical protein Lalb_Chr24g0394191 [Lupinus albus]KAF1859340.1 hypothetical protein Lal_00009924 [Lupinus albus]
MYFSELSISLSLVFGCLMLALAAQFFYFLWWKKRITHTEDIEMDQANYAKGLFYCGFLKTPFSIHATKTSMNVTNESETKKSNEVQDLELGDDCMDHILVKSFGEESVESELIRLHNLPCPPRFLFTIKEETNEDLEAEDEDKCRSRKCSDIMLSIDNSFLTPLSTSPLKSPLDPLDSYNHQGFNPLFESSSSSLESEIYMFRSSSSPPPKFKFMKDAEEKLYRKLVEETTRKNDLKNHGVEDSTNETSDTNKRVGSLVRVIENKEGKELQQYIPQFPSTSLSQVHPLESSPTSFRPIEKAFMAQ